MHFTDVMTSRPKRATMRDVAEATGLSAAAVSYALRGLHLPEKTLERVRQAADELGYEVNPTARALALGRTGTIGVLCSSLEDLWQQRLVVELGRALLGRERFPLVADAQGDPNRERTMVQQLRDRHVDAAIVVPLDPAAPYWADLIRALPVVTIGDPLRGVETAGEVLFDNRRAIGLGLAHLADLGHRRVALLSPSLPLTPERPAERLAHVEAARLGLKLTLTSSPASVDGAAVVAAQLLTEPVAPTAFFCLSDSIAYGVYLAVAERGWTVPAQVSVLGYDDHQMSRLLNPPLSTFRWDVEHIVAAAVPRVLSAAEDAARPASAAQPHGHAAKTRRSTLRADLRVRGSTTVVRTSGTAKPSANR